ncbi:rhamnan synthesis F family protein [Agrobacterium radiobacter]|uniref:rhamnan synthesis F family protein n=1 Tax=Agrobacterium radiobacter TaxID=362 RepID=UPI003CE4A9A8
MNRLYWRKIRRELARIGLQLLRSPTEIFKLIVVRRWYDFVGARAIKRTSGDVSIGTEAGIYLIFPVDGVQNSHLTMLKEMLREGITPVVVSNLPLSDTDRKILRNYTSRIIERPNVGYDFGGYRDGILDLSRDFGTLERLWLLNNSVWLVPQQSSWFEQARALDKDFVAATSNYAMPRVDPHEFRKINWNYNTGHRNFHYASYALGFNRTIIQNAAFVRFWRRLNISSDKTRTVRRGEIGLSQWAIRNGFTHGATYEVNNLDQELQKCSNEEIDKIARELVIPDDEGLEAIQSTVLQRDPTTSEGRSDRISLVLTAVSRRASVYTLPSYSTARGFQFLKKSPLWLSVGSAEMTLRLIERIAGSAGEEIRNEAKALYRPQQQNRHSADPT